jgi:hypothetical protein
VIAVEPEEDEGLVEFHKGTTSKMWKKNPTKLSQNKPRLKLRRKEYGSLRHRVLERDGWRCRSVVPQQIYKSITSNPVANSALIRSTI